MIREWEASKSLPCVHLFLSQKYKQQMGNSIKVLINSYF